MNVRLPKTLQQLALLMPTKSIHNRVVTRWALSLSCLFVFSLLAPSALAENHRAKVLEVKGEFCKLDATTADGIAVGSKGKLYRLSAGASAQGEVTVTLVQDAYSVGKVADGMAKVGDFVLLPKSESTTAKGSTKGDMPDEPTSSPETTAFEAVVGKKINLLLEDETIYEDVELVRIVKDTKTGEMKSLRISGSAIKGTLPVDLASLKEVTHAGETLKLPEVTEDAAKRTAPKTRNQLLGEQRAAREAKEREEWLKRIAERGIQPWPEMSEDEHAAAVDASKKIVEEVQKNYQGMKLYETEQFLFCTNIPPEQVGPYVVSLDKMHEMMCQMYNIKKGTPVWKGKAPVFAFLTQEEFMDFERKFMGTSLPNGVYGICHQKSNGDVLIACFRGDRVADFGQMLVHETSHGFIHRYKTPVTFPNWVNEGMADYIGVAMVPACKSVRIGEQMAVAQMRQTRSMGGDFFIRRNIDAWQYGVASTLADFMIRSNKKAYVDFIEGMKEGMTWQESLKASYKATPEELVSSYGRAIGVPDLRP